MANYNEMKESITKRIAETGSPKLYVDLASAAMAGNKDAMNELEKELGITVHTMADIYNVMRAAAGMMTEGQLQTLENEGVQSLNANADPSHDADKHLENPICRKRREAGLTQQQLADMLGCKQQVVARWETGACRPVSGTLAKLADALGCSIDELVR